LASTGAVSRLTVRHSQHTPKAQETAIAALAERNGPLIAHIPHFDAETVLQFENGSIFLMAAPMAAAFTLYIRLCTRRRAKKPSLIRTGSLTGTLMNE
jgi:hypothetical protein